MDTKVFDIISSVDWFWLYFIIFDDSNLNKLVSPQQIFFLFSLFFLSECFRIYNSSVPDKAVRPIYFDKPKMCLRFSQVVFSLKYVFI